MSSAPGVATPPRVTGGAPFLSPASAVSEAGRPHRFGPGDRVRWAKTAHAGAEGAIGLGTVLEVIEDARHAADPSTGKVSTLYRVRDDALGREAIISSAALRRLKD